MRWDHNAAPFLHQIMHLVEADIGGIDQHQGLIPDDLILRIDHKLSAENRRVIGNGRDPPVYIPVKVHRSLQGGEQAYHMHLLAGAKLHARNGKNAVCFRKLQERRTIPAGVVIRQCDHIQSLDHSHAYDIGRKHIVVPAGGQAGVEMQIIAQLMHGSVRAPTGRFQTPAAWIGAP